MDPSQRLAPSLENLPLPAEHYDADVAMLSRTLILVTVLLASSQEARADVSQEGQVWTAFLSTAKPAGDTSELRLWLDLHLRRAAGGLVHIARPAVGWSFSPSLSAWAGYAWVPVVPDEADTVNEHRAWQQIIVKHGFANWSLQSRTRFEQRFSGAGDDVGLRVREFVRASWTPGPAAGHGLVFWDEAFVGLNAPDWGAPRGLDQNRLFLGPFAAIGDTMRLEMGYLFLWLERDSGDTIAHVLATNLFATF